MKEIWNEAAECATLDATRRLHTERLQKQLDYVARHSVFYQRKFSADGIDIAAIRTLEDIAALPFTEKNELRESQLEVPPFGHHVACLPAAVRRVYSTSGTTGRPTYIGLTEHDIGVWRESATRAFWSAGLRPGARVPLVVSPFVVAASSVQSKTVSC